jgi:hypothetical protein
MNMDNNIYEKAIVIIDNLISDKQQTIYCVFNLKTEDSKYLRLNPIESLKIQDYLKTKYPDKKFTIYHETESGAPFHLSVNWYN